MDELQEPLRIGAPPAKPRKRRTGLLIGLGVFGVLAALVGGGVLVWVLLTKTPVGDAAAAAVASPLETARKTCADGSINAVIGDDGDTLTLQGRGKETSGLTYPQIECILGELDVTDAVKAEIESTRALDGKQVAEWGGLRASWTYHPDDGVRMVITVK